MKKIRTSPAQAVTEKPRSLMAAIQVSQSGPPNPIQSPSAPAAIPTNSDQAAGKAIKTTKTYCLNHSEVVKIEKAIDLLRSQEIYDASKAAVVRAMIRLAPVDSVLVAEILKDKEG